MLWTCFRRKYKHSVNWETVRVISHSLLFFFLSLLGLTLLFWNYVAERFVLWTTL